MKEFKIVFRMVDGSEERIILKAESYSHVAADITSTGNRWVGIKGELINTDNVLTAKIEEVEKDESISELNSSMTEEIE